MKKQLKLQLERLRALTGQDLRHVHGAIETSGSLNTQGSPTAMPPAPPFTFGYCRTYHGN